jgi:predicted AAA+ superfamily ATPase
MEIIRHKYLTLLNERLKDYPVVAILGPRQCGKTTLARQYLNRNTDHPSVILDCEDERDLAKLEQPMFYLENRRGLIVIDEIQRRPELFPAIRVLVDQKSDKKFLVLGSASRDLLSQSSETLAGRISYVILNGFSLDEIRPDEYKNLWLRGGFPRSYLARNDDTSHQWRTDFIKTFLERDIPNLGIRIPSVFLRRFWTMLSHYHGQIFNASDLGRSLNISDTTTRRYLDLLTGVFMIRQLQPFFYNTKKRLVKRPKIFFRDTGLLHTFMGTLHMDDLISHPKLGASWEGFALEQTVNHLRLQDEEIYFWSTHTGAELDLIFEKKGKSWGIEFKFTETPAVTRSMRSALREFELSHLWIIHPGNDYYPLDQRITAVGIQKLTEKLNV